MLQQRSPTSTTRSLRGVPRRPLRVVPDPKAELAQNVGRVGGRPDQSPGDGRRGRSTARQHQDAAGRHHPGAIIRAARCSQSCRARDGAWRDILCFSRFLSGRILRPPTCLVRPAVRPALGVGSRHAAMHLREAQGKSMDTIMATGDEWTPEWRCLAQLAKPHQKIAQFRAPIRPHRRHHHRGSTPSGAMVSATVHVATKSCGRRPRACVRG